MDKRERAGDYHEAMLAILTGWQSKMWTALPVIIQDYDPTKQTCTAVAAIQARVKNSAGVWSWVTLPKLVDVPVIFPGGGGYTLTFPIQPNDEGLAILSSRCIDAWWQQGGIQVQADLRMHSLSDAFVIVGPRSQPRMLTPNANSSNAQLRSDDGTVTLELAPGNINITSSSAVTLKAPSIILKNAGAALKKLVNDTFMTLFNNHVHPVGAGNSGVPTTPMTSSNLTSTTQAE